MKYNKMMFRILTDRNVSKYSLVRSAISSCFFSNLSYDLIHVRIAYHKFDVAAMTTISFNNILNAWTILTLLKI